MGYTYINELDDFVENHLKEIEWLSRERVENFKDGQRINIYNVLIWISLVMLANEGSADPEEIFTRESIERLQELKDTLTRDGQLSN